MRKYVWKIFEFFSCVEIDRPSFYSCRIIDNIHALLELRAYKELKEMRDYIDAVIEHTEK